MNDETWPRTDGGRCWVMFRYLVSLRSRGMDAPNVTAPLAQRCRSCDETCFVISVGQFPDDGEELCLP